MNNQVFIITGHKISSMIIDDTSIKFSSKKFTTHEAFIEDWNKKMSLANKLEVKLDTIKEIYKEENDDEIAIKYKSWKGAFALSKYAEVAFSFENGENNEPFFNYFIKKHYYHKKQEKLSPFQAIRSYIFGLLFIIGLTYLGYTESIAPTEGGGIKGRAFRVIIELLGTKGVITVGLLSAAYILYTIWKRYINPPHETKIIAP